GLTYRPAALADAAAEELTPADGETRVTMQHEDPPCGCGLDNRQLTGEGPHLSTRIQTEFHANQRSLVELLATTGALRAGLDVGGATDIMWALNHPSLYQLLVGDRGWTPARYEQWLAGAFCAQLLAAPSRS